MNLDEKDWVWKEIDNLTHIGRSSHDIEQALIGKGYDGALLDEILTPSFMNRLIDKEEMFMQIQQSANHQAAKQTEKYEHESLEQKGQEQQAQKQNKEKELLMQNEKQAKETEAEKKRADIEERRKIAEYRTNVMRQDQARHLAEDEKDKEQEEKKHLRDMALSG